MEDVDEDSVLREVGMSKDSFEEMMKAHGLTREEIWRAARDNRMTEAEYLKAMWLISVFTD